MLRGLKVICEQRSYAG